MKRVIVCLMLFMILFGCEKSADVDIIEFCELFNEHSDTVKLTENMLIREESNGDYLIYITDVLLKVSCNDKNKVSAFTVTGSDKEFVKSIAEKAVTASNKTGIEWYESDGYYTAICQ